MGDIRRRNGVTVHCAVVEAGCGFGCDHRLSCDAAVGHAERPTHRSERNTPGDDEATGLVERNEPA
jgi:hypothetical protein